MIRWLLRDLSVVIVALGLVGCGALDYIPFWSGECVVSDATLKANVRLHLASDESRDLQDFAVLKERLLYIISPKPLAVGPIEGFDDEQLQTSETLEAVRVDAGVRLQETYDRIARREYFKDFHEILSQTIGGEATDRLLGSREFPLDSWFAPNEELDPTLPHFQRLYAVLWDHAGPRVDLDAFPRLSRVENAGSSRRSAFATFSFVPGDGRFLSSLLKLVLDVIDAKTFGQMSSQSKKWLLKEAWGYRSSAFEAARSETRPAETRILFPISVYSSPALSKLPGPDRWGSTEDDDQGDITAICNKLEALLQRALNKAKCSGRARVLKPDQESQIYSGFEAQLSNEKYRSKVLHLLPVALDVGPEGLDELRRQGVAGAVLYLVDWGVIQSEAELETRDAFTLEARIQWKSLALPGGRIENLPVFSIPLSGEVLPERNPTEEPGLVYLSSSSCALGAVKFISPDGYEKFYGQIEGRTPEELSPRSEGMQPRLFRSTSFSAATARPTILVVEFTDIYGDLIRLSSEIDNVTRGEFASICLIDLVMVGGARIFADPERSNFEIFNLITHGMPQHMRMYLPEGIGVAKTIDVAEQAILLTQQNLELIFEHLEMVHADLVEQLAADDDPQLGLVSAGLDREHLAKRLLILPQLTSYASRIALAEELASGEASRAVQAAINAAMLSKITLLTDEGQTVSLPLDEVLGALKEFLASGRFSKVSLDQLRRDELTSDTIRGRDPDDLPTVWINTRGGGSWQLWINKRKFDIKVVSLIYTDPAQPGWATPMLLASGVNNQIAFEFGRVRFTNTGRLEFFDE